MAKLDLGKVEGPQGPAGKDSLYKINVNGVTGNLEFSNGLKECWGYDTIPSGVGYKDVELPISFSDNNFNPTVTGYQSQANNLFIQYVTSNSIRVSVHPLAQEEVHFYYKCIGK